MKYNNILHITDDCLYLKSKKQKDIIKYKLSKKQRSKLKVPC